MAAEGLRQLDARASTLNARSDTWWRYFWVVWTLVFFSIYWALGPYSYVRVQDNADGILSYAIVGAQNFWNHGLVYWYPQLTAGVPSFAQPSLENFLVEGLPFLLLPPWAAHSLIMVVQRFLAGYFTFRLCRDALGLSPAASLFAGLAVPLNMWSFDDYTLYHGYAIPGGAFFLWAFHQIHNRFSFAHAMPITFGLGVIGAMSGWLAISTMFLGMLVALWVVALPSLWNIKSALMIGAYAIGLIIADLPAFAGYLLFSEQTIRGTGTASAKSLSWVLNSWHVYLDRASLHILFNGSLLTAGIFSARTLPSAQKTVLVMFAVIFIGSQIIYSLQALLSDIITIRVAFSGLNWFNPLAFALLGAAGIDLIDRSTASAGTRQNLLLRTSMWVAIVVPVIAGVWIISGLASRIPSDNFASNHHAPAFSALKNRSAEDGGTPFRVATVGTRLATVRRASKEGIHPSYAQAAGFETSDGYFSLHFARYVEFFRLFHAPLMEADKALFKHRGGRHADHWHYLFAPYDKELLQHDPLPFDTFYDLELLSLANTRYFVSKSSLDHPSLRLIHKPSEEIDHAEEWRNSTIRWTIPFLLTKGPPPRPLYVYENTLAFPRTFVTAGLKLFESKAELFQAMASAETNTLRKFAFGLKADWPLAAKDLISVEDGSAKILTYGPDALSIEVEMEKPGVLVVTNNYDPSWQATVSGETAKIRPIYHTFQGITLPAGKHLVHLSYRPPYRLF